MRGISKKKLRKLLRAHYTAYYLQNRESMRGWISSAYASTRTANASNRDAFYLAVRRALPLKNG